MPQAPDNIAQDFAPAILYHVLTAELCSRTIEVAEKIGFVRSMVYTVPTGHEDSPGFRNSESTYVHAPDVPDVYQHIGSALQKMNSSLYRFALTGMEPLQIVRYGPGCFFNEHMDIGGSHAANRKLSLIVQLSDGKAYSGGDVLLFGGLSVPRTRGWGCVFPSWVPHRVTPIAEGTRYALVSWGIGDPFR